MVNHACYIRGKKQNLYSGNLIVVPQHWISRFGFKLERDSSARSDCNSEGIAEEPDPGDSGSVLERLSCRGDHRIGSGNKSEQNAESVRHQQQSLECSCRKETRNGTR